ncbi:MAG: type IV secretion system protein [Pseudomonadota bacterium]|jgi:type IV secretion system protein VirB6
MTTACATPAADAPLVRGLLTVTDCHVRELTFTGYNALFADGGALASTLTVLLTAFVALIGYRLMLGGGGLRVSAFALWGVKIGAVLVFAAQWRTYQALVFDVLFDGPGQLANTMLQGSGLRSGDVFDGLQQTFDALSSASSGMAAKAPPQVSPLLGGAGFGAFSLNAAAGVLLLSTLGTILAAKATLGVLLASGPIFIALFLFDSTRGLFEGWVRATLGFAFIPLAVTLLLAAVLGLLDPSLAQLAELSAKNSPSLAPVYAIFTLVLVFAGVTFCVMAAAGVIFSGFRLPSRDAGHTAATSAAAPAMPLIAGAEPSRVERMAATIAAGARRDAAGQAGASAIDVRRVAGVGGAAAASRQLEMQSASQARLGAGPRRLASPKSLRSPAARD